MSFVRPEIANRLGRWREILIWGVVAAFGLWVLALGLAALGWVQILAGLVLTLIGGAYGLAGLWRLRLSDAADAEGVVQVDEARVAYFGPLGGAFIDMEDLERIEITSRFWRLTSADGTQVNIPRGAAGAEALPDAFSALPGFSLAAPGWQKSGTVRDPQAPRVLPLRRQSPPDPPN